VEAWPDCNVGPGDESGGCDIAARHRERVLHDVLEGWETLERAYDAYRIALSACPKMGENRTVRSDTNTTH